MKLASRSVLRLLEVIHSRMNYRSMTILHLIEFEVDCLLEKGGQKLNKEEGQTSTLRVAIIMMIVYHRYSKIKRTT